MRIVMLVLTVIFASTGTSALAQTVIDIESQKAASPPVQDQGRIQPQQAPAQTQESAPPASSSRYSFSRVDNGFLRLDNESGQVAYCNPRAVGWACQAVAIDSRCIGGRDRKLAETSRVAEETGCRNRSIARRGRVAEEGNRGPEGATSAAAAGRPCTAARQRWRCDNQNADGRGICTCPRLHRKDLAPSYGDDCHHAEGHDAQGLAAPRLQPVSMPGRMSAIVEAAPQLIASATLHVDTSGLGFTDITANAAGFIDQIRASEGTLLIYLRHTSASLAIQENADPDVQSDLTPRSIAWRRKTRPGSMTWRVRTTCRRMSKRCSTACRCMYR